MPGIGTDHSTVSYCGGILYVHTCMHLVDCLDVEMGDALEILRAPTR